MCGKSIAIPLPLGAFELASPFQERLAIWASVSIRIFMIDKISEAKQVITTTFFEDGQMRINLVLRKSVYERR